MKVKHKFSDDDRQIIEYALKNEKNGVVKERLIAVNMFLQGLEKNSIAKQLNRNKDTVGRWINSFDKGGIEELYDSRGGDRKSKYFNIA